MVELTDSWHPASGVSKKRVKVGQGVKIHRYRGRLPYSAVEGTKAPAKRNNSSEGHSSAVKLKESEVLCMR